jgi:Leucine-rich repeat (LRR) protein
MFFSTSPEQKLKKIITWIRGLKINVPMDVAGVKNITKLDLSFKGITKLPEEVGYLENLTELNLSNNKLKSLPKECSKITNLKYLNLGYNVFVSIPDSIFRHQQLETLNMEANQIESIPAAVGNLTNLIDLNFFANQISVFPVELCSLSNLKRLNMALNLLSKLPDEFENLANIKELELWLNKFELIPEVVSKLPKLQDLYNSFDTHKLNKALIMAVFSNNLQLTEKLIFHGADVNYKLKDFRSKIFTTPLFEVKSIAMINLLLQNGADPNLKREIVKFVYSKDGKEEVRKTGQFETFLTFKYPEKIEKYIKSLNIQPGEEKILVDDDDDGIF